MTLQITAERFLRPDGHGRQAPVRTSGRVLSGRRLPKLAGLLCVAMAATAYFAVLKRAELARHTPALAIWFKMLGIPVNVFGAEFVNVSATVETINGDKKILVEGQVRNLKLRSNVIPDLQLTISGPLGQSMFTWVAPLPRKTLAAGETMGFKTSLDSPPPGLRDVSVRFAE